MTNLPFLCGDKRKRWATDDEGRRAKGGPISPTAEPDKYDGRWQGNNLFLSATIQKVIKLNLEAMNFKLEGVKE